MTDTASGAGTTGDQGPVAAKNTDVIVWREDWRDSDSPTLFLTEGGGIGMRVSGLVVVRPIRVWVRLGSIGIDELSVSGDRSEASQTETAP